MYFLHNYLSFLLNGRNDTASPLFEIMWDLATAAFSIKERGYVLLTSTLSKSWKGSRLQTSPH